MVGSVNGGYSEGFRTVCPKIVWNYIGGECWVSNGVCNGSKTFEKVKTYVCTGRGDLNCPPDENLGSKRVVQCEWVPRYEKDFKLNVDLQKCEAAIGYTCPDGSVCEARTPTE